MAGRRTPLMDIRTVVRYLQAATSVSATQRATGLNRRTIMRYRAWAQQQGLLDPHRPLPSLEEMQELLAQTLPPPMPPAQTISSVEPYREVVCALYQQQVAGTAILQRLRERGYCGGLSSVYRFLHRLEPPSPPATVRIEREPGSEAQVDFGYAGLLQDPHSGVLRRAWAFVMVLSYSRHQYVEFVVGLSLTSGCRPGLRCMPTPLPSLVGCPAGWCWIISKPALPAPASTTRRFNPPTANVLSTTAFSSRPVPRGHPSIKAKWSRAGCTTSSRASWAAGRRRR